MESERKKPKILMPDSDINIAYVMAALPRLVVADHRSRYWVVAEKDFFPIFVNEGHLDPYMPAKYPSGIKNFLKEIRNDKFSSGLIPVGDISDILLDDGWELKFKDHPRYPIYVPSESTSPHTV